MPLEHLLAALEREASAQAEALLGAARSDAADVTRQSEARLAQQRTDLLRTHDSKIRGSAEAALGEARRTARATVLEARQQLLDRVFAAAREMIPVALGSRAYQDALPAHLAEALAALGDQPAVVVCGEAVAAAVRHAVESRQEVVVKSDANARPGVMVETPDGTIQVDNTLEGRLERLRLQLTLEVAARLTKP